jgi:hypothetical protein
MRNVKLVIAMSLSTFFFGCGGMQSPPKNWQHAKPISGLVKLDHPKALVVDDKFIYFVTGATVAGQHDGTNNLMKMPLEGGEPIVLYKGGETIPSDSAIALDDKYVYFEADGFRRIPKDGGESAVLSKSVFLWEFIVDTENIYWVPFVGEGSPPKPVYSMPKTGGEPKILSDPVIASGLSQDDKYLYWASPDGIYKLAKTGGAAEKVYSAQNKDVVSDLRMDADNFYFLNVTKRALMRVSRSGGDALQFAKDADTFWLGENDVIISRPINVRGTAIVKIPKSGGPETELDRDGYIADLVVGKDKIYLSDIVTIFAL